jgi:hypothetical protein
MNRQSISLDKFVELVGCIGVQAFLRHRNGSSWLLPDGHIASELWDGVAWQWFLTDVG